MAKTCQFKKCKNRTVNNLYQYCTWHMVHGEPLINLKEPDECPICLEPNTEDVPYIVLTCGHHLHKECIIKWGRPKCPVCKQYVYMEPSIFLPLRINNLRWKLDNLPIHVDKVTLDGYRVIFDDLEQVLNMWPGTDTYKIVDRMLLTYKRIVLNWYYAWE